jgi:hypothetical protein
MQNFVKRSSPFIENFVLHFCHSGCNFLTVSIDLKGSNGCSRHKERERYDKALLLFEGRLSGLEALTKFAENTKNTGRCLSPAFRLVFTFMASSP